MALPTPHSFALPGVPGKSAGRTHSNPAIVNSGGVVAFKSAAGGASKSPERLGPFAWFSSRTV